MQKTNSFLKSFYGRAIIWFCYVSRSAWLRSKIPVEHLIRPVDKTGRNYYAMERCIYRLTMHLVRRGDLIDKRSYFIYSRVAIKYGWPYIKETYDN